MSFSRALCVLTILLASVPTAARASDPYRVDGWEKFPAPIVDLWFLAAGFSTVEEVAPFTTPEAVEGVDGLFAEANGSVGERIWQEVDTKGRGLPLPASPDGSWVLGFTLLNAEQGREAFLNISAPGVRALRILIDGKEIAKLDGPEIRRPRLPVNLRTGWSKLQFVADVGAANAHLYLQFVDAENGTCPLYNLNRLHSEQRKFFDVGFPMRGNVWKRLTERHRSILHAPHSAYWRELALLQVSLKKDSPHADGARSRIRAIRELSRIIVHGGDPKQLEKRLTAVCAEFEGFQGMEADATGFPQDVAKRATTVRPWLDPGRIPAVTWHIFSRPESFTDLWARLQFARELFIDLLDYGRKVVSEANSGL